MRTVVDVLDRFLIAELTQTSDPRIGAFVTAMVGKHRPLGVIFYGSGLRKFDGDGLFDFYVIVDTLADWPQSMFARFANRCLPPNVRYVELPVGDEVLRAKVAFMSYAQFQARALPSTFDTTIWARFAQPCRLVWVRDPGAADALLHTVRRCVMTAAGWAARLGTGPMDPAGWWEALFAATYRAELRVEGAGRSKVIMEDQSERYAAVLPLAWAAQGIPFTSHEQALQPEISDRALFNGRRRWKRIAQTGRWLNVARLLKAAFTFDGGARYLAWKIRRHNGLDLRLTTFEATHPILCLPVLLWRARSVLKRD